MDLFSLKGKTAAVTGAGSGIGEAIAKLFAARGAVVIVLDLDEQAAERCAVQIRAEGGIAEARRCDVARQADVDAVFADLFEGYPKLDILVNNAGVSHIGTVETTSEADLDRLYQVNVKGVYNCTRAAIGRMVGAGGGVILNMASIASLIGIVDRFAYSMSKGAVLAMTRSIAVDYIKQGIRCNCLCPARVHTPFVDGYLSKTYPGREAEMFEKLSQYQPIGRMGTPEEIAQLALYLCSDQASFITGQAYPIDGGVLVF